MESLKLVKTNRREGYSVDNIRMVLKESQFRELNAWMHITNRLGTVKKGRYIIFKEDFEKFCQYINVSSQQNYL